jgi:ABC-type sugar transport systems, permease components
MNIGKRFSLRTTLKSLFPKNEGLHKNDFWLALVFASPWLIGFAAFAAYPIIQSFVFSFNNVTVTAAKGIIQQPVGWENYVNILTADPDFIDDLQSYLQQIIIYVPVIMVMSLLIALLLNSLKHGKGFFRTIFFLPVIIASGPVISLFISQGVTSFQGLEIDYAALSETVPAFLVGLIKTLITNFIVILWFSGIQTLVFLTGLQKLDKSMYEAAKIDGASSWECFWKITLPALNPVIVINVVFTVVIQSTFSLNPIISRITTDMYAVGKGYGYACAEAWVFFVVLLSVLALFVLIFKSKRIKRSYQLQ